VGVTEAANDLSGTLSDTDGVHAASITLPGQYTAAQFTTAGDGLGRHARRRSRARASERSRRRSAASRLIDRSVQSNLSLLALAAYRTLLHAAPRGGARCRPQRKPHDSAHLPVHLPRSSLRPPAAMLPGAPIHQTDEQEEVMRAAAMPVLAAAISALLISVSYPALTQEYDGEPPSVTPAAETPAQRPQDERLQSEPEQPLAQQPEMQGETPLDERAQRELEQFLAQLPDRPLADRQGELEQLLAGLPDRPLAERQNELGQLLAQLPERKPAAPAEIHQPAKQFEERLARLTTRQPAEEPQADADEQRQPEAMKAEAEQEQPMPVTEVAMPGDPKWTALNEPGLGTTMDMPRALFSTADGHAHKGVGRRYKTPDGRAKVAVWTHRNTRRDSPAGYLRRTFVIPRAAVVDYERFAPNFAVVSGAYGGRVFYIRCDLSPRGNLHCFDLAYPVREKNAWDVVVTRMSRSLRPHDY
jgi:hypothetical protein